MKKFFILLTSLCIFLFLPFKVFAQENNVVVEKGKIVNQNPYVVAGENVDILGTINGDVITAGGKINISGKINGDLIAAGGNIIISGEVTQNVRLAAGQIIISGKVGKNILAATGNLEISKEATLGGYLVLGAGNTSIYAPIPGNVTAGSGNISLYNSIGANLKVGAGQIYLSPNASVKGNLEYWSNKEANIDNNAKISGEIVKHELPEKWNYPISKFESKKFAKDIIGVAAGFKVLSFLTLLVIGFLMIKLFPKLMEKTSDTISKKGWSCLLAGFLTMVIFPISFIVLLTTIIGIPIALILAAIYSIFVYLSKIFVIYWFGRKILDKKKSKYLSFAIAAFIFSLLFIIPALSRLAKVLATFTGLGVLFFNCKEYFAKEK